jgi:hypothetical protein
VSALLAFTFATLIAVAVLTGAWFINAADRQPCHTRGWNENFSGIDHYHGDTVRCYHGNVLEVQR